MEKMRQNVSKFRFIPTQKGQNFQQFRTKQRQKAVFSVRNASEDDAFAAPPGRKMLFEKLSDFKISFCRAEIKSPCPRADTARAVPCVPPSNPAFSSPKDYTCMQRFVHIHLLY